MKPVKLTRSQKFWIGALGVGLVALAIDQCVSTSPATADGVAVAAPVNGPDVPAAAPEISAPKAAVSAADAATVSFDHQLAKSVNQLADAPARDGFAPPPDWGVAGGDGAGKSGDKVATFERAHLLKAVINGSRPAVLVDGSLVTVGQAFDGFVLVEALPTQATFRCGALTAKLVLGGSDNVIKPENR